MPTSNDSHCQLIQLQFDALLDSELEAARAAELQRHVAGCAGCQRELDYARQLHQAVVSLPILDCSDAALEPIDRLFQSSALHSRVDTNIPNSASRPVTGGFGAALLALLRSIPMPVRVAVPVAATLLLALGPGRELLLPASAPQVAVQPGAQPAPPQYTDAEVAQALQDLDLALDYLARISARTEVMIEDRFLLRQLEESINASLSTDPRNDREPDFDNGPI